MEEMRLQKFLAEAGVAARRKCEELIESGQVKVNGVIAKIGTKVIPEKDVVEYNGKQIKIESKKVYILLNKPEGYVTTLSDEYNRKTVMSLIDGKERSVPVGRLDMYTSGALILSNDGEFIYKVTHPKHEIEKTYIAVLNGQIEDEKLDMIRQGIKIDGGYITKPAKIKRLGFKKERNQTEIEIIIHEGKNRQVRKMIEAVGKRTISLERRKIGNIDISDINKGKWRYLTNEEVDKLIK